MFILRIFLKPRTKLSLRLNSLSFLVLGEQRVTMMYYTGCPRTPSPEKKGNICVIVIIWILKKKVLSQAIIASKSNILNLTNLDFKELSTIKSTIGRTAILRCRNLEFCCDITTSFWDW
jgi:hypothetical protein